MFNFEISYKHNPLQGGGGRWGGHLPEWRRAGGGRPVDDAKRRGGGTPVEEGSRCMSPSGTSGSRQLGSRSAHWRMRERVGQRWPKSFDRRGGRAAAALGCGRGRGNNNVCVCCPGHAALCR
jgi:hypothetical protein